jgi:hypothetical protein
MLEIPVRALTLRLKRVRDDKVRFATDQRRQFVAQRVDPRLEPVVEHIRDHDRAAGEEISDQPRFSALYLQSPFAARMAAMQKYAAGNPCFFLSSSVPHV